MGIFLQIRLQYLGHRPHFHQCFARRGVLLALDLNFSFTKYWLLSYRVVRLGQWVINPTILDTADDGTIANIFNRHHDLIGISLAIHHMDQTRNCKISGRFIQN